MLPRDAPPVGLKQQELLPCSAQLLQAGSAELDNISVSKDSAPAHWHGSVRPALQRSPILPACREQPEQPELGGGEHLSA